MMKIELLSREAQAGLRQWAVEQYGNLMGHADDDRLIFEALTWPRVVAELKKAEDRPEWFPHGKWATIQVIEEHLCNYGS